MDDNREIRRQNLSKLIEMFKHDKDFCLVAGVSTTYLPQIKLVNGKRIGDTLARRFEKNLSLPTGWMDQVHQEPETQPDTQPEVPEVAAPKPEPPFNQTEPQLFAAIAAMKAIPEPLRDQLSRTIFMIAATCYPLSGGQDVGQFHLERRAVSAKEEPQTGTG